MNPKIVVFSVALMIISALYLLGINIKYLDLFWSLPIWLMIPLYFLPLFQFSVGITLLIDYVKSEEEKSMTQSNITSKKLSLFVRDKTPNSQQKIVLIREKLAAIETEIAACRKILRGEKV